MLDSNFEVEDFPSDIKLCKDKNCMASMLCAAIEYQQIEVGKKKLTSENSMTCVIDKTSM